ncbi:hypothetical protein N7535_009096 [Penicillium sp. DV-2018c]|nr:hypothetical protein N7461_003008 [Penicillium sp. DV-2018c]KAJ5560899.1 hypothetical protein N7535_009096 [Penicillium sp. DV-2018c]
MTDYESVLEAAFADEKNTAIDLPKADVNEIIRASYDVDEDFTYTARQLWDMEVKKAHHPDKYLSHIVRPGSLKIFHNERQGSLEYFTRVSDQRIWTNPSKYATVIEHVCLDHDAHRAFFLGAAQTELPSGEIIRSGIEQPLFHVEHSVEGSEKCPLNVWRIVHLTDGRDVELLKVFAKMAQSPYLREFNEVYIREDLGRRLSRK